MVYSQQRICWVSISGAGGWWHVAMHAPKTGAVLEPCNLSLLGKLGKKIMENPKMDDVRVPWIDNLSPDVDPEDLMSPGKSPSGIWHLPTSWLDHKFPRI